MYESPAAGETIAAGGVITLGHTPVAFVGSALAWYKKPTDANWSIGTVSGTTLTIPGAQTTDKYCIKYFYQNESAESAIIKVNRVPGTVHLVIINDIYSGDPSAQTSVSGYGRLITDIPSFTFDGNQELSLSATSAATVSLTGMANAVYSGSSCEEDAIYGTMIQEIYGESWKDKVVALAIENSAITLKNGSSATLVVRAVYGAGVASQVKDNSNFTWAVESGTGATVNNGVVTASADSGTVIISATLTGKGKVAYATVTLASA